MGKMLRSVSVASFLFVSCTPTVTPQQQAFLRELASRPITCEAGEDCKAKWNRAIQWVSAHSTSGIREINDNLIATNMIATQDRHSNPYPEFSIVRYAESARSSTLQFDSYCDHGFACNPSAMQLRADFVTFVMGLPPGVTEPRPGVFAKTISQ